MGWRYPVNNRYEWHDGNWTRPANSGADWVEPHHDGNASSMATGTAIAARWPTIIGGTRVYHNRDYDHDK